MTDIARWLDGLGLGQYTTIFVQNDIDFAVLPHLTDADLKELGLTLGHRRKLAAAVATLVDNTPREIESVRGKHASMSASATSEAEHRQLTVMFCDLVGSTELAERMDLEDYRELLAAYQSEAAQAIGRYDGYIARYMGDGLLVYFGYPQAHEDDAERAIRAALAIVEAVNHPGQHLTVELQVRIGIATGHVVAGDIVGEGASEERAVLGPTPNLAARLQSIAAPGNVLIAANTRRLTGRLFSYEDAGRHALKGISGLVQVWRVVSETTSESRFAATRSAAMGPLVGRETELLLLYDRWQRAKESEGQVMLLSGEPGIGKSRLLHALKERVGSQPHYVLQFQCSPYYTNSAFYPFIEHIQRARWF